MGEADKKALEQKIADAEKAAKKEERKKLKEKMKKDLTKPNKIIWFLKDLEF